jgi:hypothetical protein
MPGVLTDEERKELQLEVALLTGGNPSTLNGIIPTADLVRISTASVPAIYAYNVIKYCEMFAWVETPSLIVKLLNCWSTKPLFSKAIDRINKEQPPIYYPKGRPWDTTLLAVDLPFLSRSLTREAIKRFSYDLIPTIDPAGVRVLVVKGPGYSGKSYTYNFIRYINSCLTEMNFKVVWVDIQKQFGSHFGPTDLAKSILDQVNPRWEQGQQLPKLNSQQEPRWIQELCMFVANQVAATGISHVIVIDGFYKPKKDVSDLYEMTAVPANIIEMAMQLSAIATGSTVPGFPDYLRLVLLGFNQPIPDFVNRVWIDDIIPLKREDISSYFKNYIQVHNNNQNVIPIEESAFEPMVDVVMTDDNPVDPVRTAKLARKALEVIKKVLELNTTEHAGEA